MAVRSKVGYFCAGLGAGTALAVLFAPKPGAEVRGQLWAAAEQTDELVQAGKCHLRLAMESGRAAYRRSVNTGSKPEMSTLGAIGVLALEAAAVVTGYQLTHGLGKRMRVVAPKVEDLLDTSRAAVANTAMEIAQITSMGRSVLHQVQQFLRARSPKSE